MNKQYIDFIGLYENVYPDGFCHHLIQEFERLFQSGVGSNRQKSEEIDKTKKQDEFLFLNLKNHSLSSFNNESSLSIFWEGLQKCYDEYSSEFDILKDLPIRCTSVKMQKTIPGAGYHIWHSEQNGGDLANRILAYSLYLNTLGENCAGETEFLYQRLRVPPKENSIAIWPAAYTHTHRGNVVHGNESKYIVTGWFYLD
jgi:2OG-Fe(II) oxygenase superfamily